jgi:hypothetical protein
MLESCSFHCNTVDFYKIHIIQDGVCVYDPHAKVNCQCFHHRTQDQRKAERIADKIRGNDTETIIDSVNVIKVYAEQYEEAQRHVKLWLRENGIAIGSKLQWKHRPKVLEIHATIAEYNNVGLDWDLGTVRRKLMPILMEWDAQHPDSRHIEFHPVGIIKIQGQTLSKSKQGVQGGSNDDDWYWRYLILWDRIAGRNVEGITQCLEKKMKSGNAHAASDDDEEGHGGTAAGIADILAVDFSQYPLFSQSQQITQIPLTPRAATTVPKTESLSLEEFDIAVLKESQAEVRCGRKSVVERYHPKLEEEWHKK